MEYSGMRGTGVVGATLLPEYSRLERDEDYCGVILLRVVLITGYCCINSSNTGTQDQYFP